MGDATIKDLEINPSKLLTPMIIKNLVDIINGEFARQQTLYDAQATQKREEILEQYKVAVGFDAMKKAYDKAEALRKKAEKDMQDARMKLNMKGLSTDGERYTCNYGSYNNDTLEAREVKKAQVKIDQLFKVVEASGPENTKGKIVARLWMASTVGEAMVILRDVLGNGIIPTLSVSDVKAITIQ